MNYNADIHGQDAKQFTICESSQLFNKNMIAKRAVFWMKAMNKEKQGFKLYY